MIRCLAATITKALAASWAAVPMPQHPAAAAYGVVVLPICGTARAVAIGGTRAVTAGAEFCWQFLYQGFTARSGAADDAFCFQPGVGKCFIQLLQGLRADAVKLWPVQGYTACRAPNDR